MFLLLIYSAIMTPFRMSFIGGVSEDDASPAQSTTPHPRGLHAEREWGYLSLSPWLLVCVESVHAR